MTFPNVGARMGRAMTLALLLALAGTAQADTSVTPSNDTSLELAAAKPARGGLFGPGGFGALFARREKPVEAPTFDDAWLASQPEPSGDADFECLATALYFEARGESIAGQAAVAEVILNRVDSGEFPRSICGVVNQKGNGGCQFSYTCDGRSDRIHEADAWERARKVARAMLDGAPRTLTDGATYFHTPAVKPGWSRRFERTARIGQHIFYRAPILTAMN